MPRNRTFLMFVMQSLMPVLFAASSAVALAQESIQTQSDEEDPCPLNSEAAAPAQGDDPVCSAMPADLARAAAEWNRPDAALSLKALDRPEGNADVPAGRKVKVALLPFQNVSLPARPNKSVKVKDFAGLIAFRAGKAGAYRFLLSQYAWLELIDASGQLAVPLDSDRRLDTCSGTGRNISFELLANTRYWLQISGAKKGAELEMVISAPQ